MDSIYIRVVSYLVTNLELSTLKELIPKLAVVPMQTILLKLDGLSLSKPNVSLMVSFVFTTLQESVQWM